MAPYRPALHAVHTEAPARENCPGPHMVAGGVAVTVAAGHAYPALHGPEQLGVVSAGVAPYRPGAQSVHTDAPPTVNLPRGHAACVALVAPAGQKNPGAQGPVQDSDTSPAVSPYRPPAHGPEHAGEGRAGEDP